MTDALRRLLPDPFIAVLLLAVAAASVAPARGAVSAVIGHLTTAAIVLLFFLHGVRLPRESLSAAVRHWRLHLAILGSTYVFVPLLGLTLATLLPGLLPQPLWLGILFLCALPSTVQSSIAFTSMAGGNVAGAVASAAASNLLGVVLTPVIVGLLVQAQNASLSFAGVWKIVLQLFVPFAIGHLCRPLLGAWAARSRRLLALTDRGTIVLAVYSAFSAAVIAGIWRQLAPARLLLLLAVCGFMLAVILLAVRYGARLMRFPREDEIAIVFCGSQKSLVSGVPMARVLLAGPDVGAALVPLMIFHQLQLMVAAWLAQRYRSAAGTQTEPELTRNPR